MCNFQVDHNSVSSVGANITHGKDYYIVDSFLPSPFTEGDRVKGEGLGTS